MKFRKVIFDFDGVIADSRDICCAEINKLRHTRFPMIPEVTSENELAHVYSGPLRTSLRRFGLTDAESRQFFDAHSSAMRQRIDEVEPFPEMVSLLEDISLERCAVVTSAYSDAVRRCLRRARFQGDLDGLPILGRESNQPKSKKFAQLIGARSIERCAVLTVGDTVSDILYAREAGLSVCAVAWGYHPANYLSVFAPDYIVREPRALRELLSI